MPVELVHLANATLTPGEPVLLPGTPLGTRVIAPIVDTVYEGERLNARQKGPAAGDWAIVDANGTATIDVRLTLETDDGAVVFVSYRGRARMFEPGAPVVVAPLFDTGDERYAWLNAVQAIAKGGLRDDGAVFYEIYEVR